MNRQYIFQTGRTFRIAFFLRFLAAAILLLTMARCSDDPVEPQFSDDELVQDATLRFMTALQWSSQYDFVTFAQATGTPVDNSHGTLLSAQGRLYVNLKEIDHPVRLFEECTLNMGGVFHPDFQNRGICIWCGPLTYTGSGSVVVYAGYYVGGLGAGGYLVRLDRSGTGWEVVRFTLIWIS